MSKRIVWELPDGTIRVTLPARAGLPLDAVAARTRQAVPELHAARRLADREPGALPERRWRACWRHDGQGGVRVELPLARAQRLRELRAERDRRLAASDGAMLREQESGTPAGVEALRAYRQALRDLPAVLEQSGALERLEDAAALAAFTPEWPADPAAAEPAGAD
jgi:hypothetical protein